MTAFASSVPNAHCWYAIALMRLLSVVMYIVAVPLSLIDLHRNNRQSKTYQPAQACGVGQKQGSDLKGGGE